MKKCYSLKTLLKLAGGGGGGCIYHIPLPGSVIENELLNRRSNT